MILQRQANIPGHLEDHIMAKTDGSRNFSELLDAIQILARRPMSQVSSSFPSYYDEWDDSTNATEYYDIDDPDNVDNDGFYDEYDEAEDHDNEWIDMSGILRTRRAKRDRKGFRKGKKGWSKGESRDVLKIGKGGRPENCKQIRSKDDCAGVSRNDSCVRNSRNESRADDDSRNEPSANVDSRNGLCVEVDFQRD